MRNSMAWSIACWASLSMASSLDAWGTVRGKPSRMKLLFSAVTTRAWARGDAPVLAVLVLAELLLDHTHHDLVADQLAAVHNLLGGFAELGLRGNLRAEHITSSKVTDAVLLRDVRRLCALT